MPPGGSWVLAGFVWATTWASAAAGDDPGAAAPPVATAIPSPILQEFQQIPGEVFVLPWRPEQAPDLVRELEMTGLFRALFVGKRSGGVLLAVQPGYEDAARAIASVHRMVRSANLHYGGKAASQPFVGVPSDVHLADQWYLGEQAAPYGIPTRSNCTTTPGSVHPAGAGIPSYHANVLEAWRYSQGSPAITVAVFDSGIQYDHPEFAGRIFLPDLNYIPAHAGLSRDPGPATDNNGHGTAVAGVLGASANNADAGTVAPAPVAPLPGGALNDFGGTAGIDPNCRLLSVRLSAGNAFGGAANPFGFAYTLLALEEILVNPAYSSVRVVNMSYGLPCADSMLITQAEEDALRDVIGALINERRGPEDRPNPLWIVTIAGNTGAPGEADFRCPNRWPEVITVGAFDQRGYRMAFNRACPNGQGGADPCTTTNCAFGEGRCCGGPASGQGQSVDLLAPGWGLRTALCYDPACWVCGLHGSGYCQFNVGTSGAAPVVSGTISLMLARAEQLGIGHLMTWQIVYAILTANAHDGVGDPAEDTPGRDNYHGFGNIDVGACVRNVEDLYYCRADLTATHEPAAWQYGIKDGRVDQADILYYDAQFALGNVAVCDFTSGNVSQPGRPGYGVPDGVLHPIADRKVFIHFWDATAPGCGL